MFHRPDEAMLFGMVKACLCLEIYLFFRTLETFVLPTYAIKHNEKHPFTRNLKIHFIIYAKCN